MSWRTRVTVGGCASFLLLAELLPGCIKRERGGISTLQWDDTALHSVLTLFFDGVPPLEEERAEVHAGEVDPSGPAVGRRRDDDWCIHAPLKDCVGCHGSRQQRSFSHEVQLVARVPQLCYTCHAALAPAAWKGWVHGPVAVGECLICHEPHKTRNRHLLKESVPALCYRCHQEMKDGVAAEEATPSHAECLRCHAAHSGASERARERVPEVCYTCHAALAPTALQGWVHGPVAVGRCLACHDLHAAENPYRLRERIPRICYTCHEETAVQAIHDRWDASYVDCGHCHQSHASPERPLLRRNRPSVRAALEPSGNTSEPSGQ